MRLPHLIETTVDLLLEKCPDLVLLTSDVGDLFGEGMLSGAVLSAEEEALYRYLLWRVWDSSLPVLLVIMLNPSTADHDKNDRTIETLIARARMTGHGGILVLNLFAWRATQPSEMKKASDPVGPHNDTAINTALEAGDSILLCAWGIHGTHMNRSEEVLCRIVKKGKKPVALKISKDGQPEHPLYKRLEQSWFPMPLSGSTN